MNFYQKLMKKVKILNIFLFYYKKFLILHAIPKESG